MPSGEAKSADAEIYFSTHAQTNKAYLTELKSVVEKYSNTAAFHKAGKYITALMTQEEII